MKTTYTSISMLLLSVIAFLFSPKQVVFANETIDISGIYKTQGYGWILEIDDTTVSIYDITTISCLPNKQYPKTIFETKARFEDDMLVVEVGISTYFLKKLPKLPDLCSKTLSKNQRNDPFYNFDVLWNTFNDQYAYFETRNVDWQKSYDTYRSKINENTSEAELFIICYEMLQEFNDGHVDIEAPDKVMEKAAKIANWNPQPDPEIKKLYKAISKKYIPNYKAHNYTRTVWGSINDEVGYIQVNGMTGQSYYGLEPDMSLKEATKKYLKARMQQVRIQCKMNSMGYIKQ